MIITLLWDETEQELAPSVSAMSEVTGLAEAALSRTEPETLAVVRGEEALIAKSVLLENSATLDQRALLRQVPGGKFARLRVARAYA